MKTTKLTQGFEAIIDDEDLERASKYKWHVERRLSNRLYAYGQVGEWKNKKRISLHHFILNIPKNKEIDHINGDGLDNRKENLRICSHKENIRNRKLNKDNTSGYKGVYFDKQYDKWKVQLIFNGRKVFGGRFNNLEKAALAYDLLAKRYFSEFARLNFREN